MQQSRGNEPSWIAKKREERRRQREASGARPPTPRRPTRHIPQLPLRHQMLLPVLVRVARENGVPPVRGTVRVRSQSHIVHWSELAAMRQRVREAGHEEALMTVLRIGTADRDPTTEEI